MTVVKGGQPDLGMEPGGVVALTGARLAWLQATHRRGTALALGFCLAVAVMLPSLLPLLGGFAAEAAVAEVVARDGGLTVEQRVADVDAFGSFQQAVDGKVSSGAGGVLLPIARYATAGPLHPIAVNAEQVAGGLEGHSLQAAYLDDLGEHVEVVAGRLPPEGLGGGETAVTMARSQADQIGLNLNDRVCMDFAATPPHESRWCARIVALWRPLQAREPFWGTSLPALQLAMGRYDFFQLARLQPPPGPLAGVRYWADAAQLDSRSAGPLALQVRALASQLQAPGRRVTTSLDSSLQQLVHQQRALSSSLALMAALVAAAGLAVVGLIAQRLLHEQAGELALLRARGWSAARTWWPALVGVGMPALYGLPMVLAAVVMVAIGSLLTSPARLTLAPGYLGPALITGTGLLVAAMLLLGAVAGPAVWRALDSSLQPRFRRSRVERYRRPVAAALVIFGLAGLGLSRLLAADPGAGAVPDPARAAIPALAVLCLGCAAAWLPLPLFRLARRAGVSGMLAARQLERVPLQHAAVSLASTLAAALAVYVAGALAWDRSGPSQSQEAALGLGLELGLLISFAAALSLVLTGLGLHYASVARRRLEEYAGLFGHGLTPGQLARSLAAEQASVVGSSLILGALLGAILAAATLEPGVPTAKTVWSGLIGAAVGLACLLAGALAVAAAVRHRPGRPNLLHPSSKT